MLNRQNNLDPVFLPGAERLRAQFLNAVRSLNSEGFMSAAGLLLVVVLLWVPFGWKSTDIADGWANYWLVHHGTSILQPGTARPLVYMFWVLAAKISGDSYTGVGLLMTALFWGKGLVFYWILRKLRLAAPLLAWLMAVLFVLYPADQGNFLMSALGRHVAVFFLLLAVLFLVLFNRNPRPEYFIGMLAAEGVTAFTAEQGYPLMLLIPLLLLLPGKAPARWKWSIAAAWVAVLLLAVVHFVGAGRRYQNDILETGVTGSYAETAREVVLSNLAAYREVFLDGWIHILRDLRQPEGSYLLLALLVTLLVGFAGYLLSRFPEQEEILAERRSYFYGILLAGLVIIGLGFLPYSLTSYRYKDYRVFYYSAAGAALVAGMIFSRMTGRLGRWSRAGNLVLWGVTILLVVFNAYTQHGDYVAKSRIQQKVLTSIIEQAPSLKPGTTIALMNDVAATTTPGTFLDIAGFENNLPFRSKFHFTHAVKWTYNRGNIVAIQCMDWSDCPIESYANTIIFRLERDDSVTLLVDIPVQHQQPGLTDGYEPYTRISRYVPLPQRLLDLYEVPPDAGRVAPKDWMGEGQTFRDRKVCDAAYSGECSLLMTGGGKPTVFSRQVQAAGAALDRFELSIAGKADRLLQRSIPVVTAVVLYQDGTREEFVLSAQLDVNWTLLQLAFEPRQPYTSLLLELHPNIGTRSIWLDDVHLERAGSEIPVSNSSFED